MLRAPYYKRKLSLDRPGITRSPQSGLHRIIGPAAGAVAGDKAVNRKGGQGGEDLLEARLIGIQQVQATDNGKNAGSAVLAEGVVERIDQSGMAAPHADDQPLARGAPEGQTVFSL